MHDDNGSHEVESHEAMLAGDRSGRVGGGEQGRGRGLGGEVRGRGE